MLDKAVPSISFYRYKTKLMAVIKSGILCVEIECIVVVCYMEIVWLCCTNMDREYVLVMRNTKIKFEFGV
jgi:hypothetical protein